MSEQSPSDVLGALPRRRPHRRSDKRPSPARGQSPTRSGGVEAATRQPGTSRPPTTRSRRAQPKQTPRSTAETATIAHESATAHEPAAPQEPSIAREPATADEPITARQPAAAPEQEPLDADAAPRPQRLRQPAQPAGVPATPRRRPSQSGGRHVLTTAVQAAAELTEIGLTVSARALRGMLERLPRP